MNSTRHVNNLEKDEDSSTLIRGSMVYVFAPNEVEKMNFTTSLQFISIMWEL
jgi:hypothetical protein